MIKINTYSKFKILHIANHIVAIYGIYLLSGEFTVLYPIIFAIMFLYAGIVGVNVSLHRYYAHRTFETSKFKELILLWSTLLTSLGSPAMWCSVHRLHHAHSDTDKDPHNPRKIGPLKTWFTIWPKIHIPKPLITTFLKTPQQIHLHKYYFTYSFAILVILLILDIKFAAFAYALPAIGCFHGANAIGVLPHYWGYRSHNTKDKSYNNWLASILSLGEGWHNNHHAQPYNWKQGEKWWEFDPPAFVIKHFFLSNKIK